MSAQKQNARCICMKCTQLDRIDLGSEKNIAKKRNVTNNCIIIVIHANYSGKSRKKIP